MNDLLLIIRIAGERVAVPADHVESVVELDGVAPVPRSAPHVAGLSALRSRVLTVIDSLAALELGSAPSDGIHEAIVVQVDGHPYAVIVDSVEDVLEHSGEPGAVRSKLRGGWRRVAKGMVEADDDLLLLLDVHALIAGAGMQSAAAA